MAFSSGQLSLKRRQQRLGGEHVRSYDIAGSGKFGLHSYIWRTVRRDPKRKFLGKLLNGKPITPNHTPSSLRNCIELRITDGDRRFFSDFEMFADALNHRFEPNEPWRLQERSDAELTGREEPEYGRRYGVFYNEYNVGNLQIFASHHYGPADPQVGTEIELQHARLLPFGEINRFISAIANFTASGNAAEAQRVRNTIHETMLNELWQHEFDPDLIAGIAADQSSFGLMDRRRLF